jgi:acrylyl-CoA reductase (NADPH)
MCPLEDRREAWDRLARELDPVQLERITTVVGLDDALRLAPEMLAGKVRGRVAVDVNR